MKDKELKLEEIEVAHTPVEHEVVASVCKLPHLEPFCVFCRDELIGFRGPWYDSSLEKPS
jgi:hypothetical protein